MARRFAPIETTEKRERKERERREKGERKERERKEKGERKERERREREREIRIALNLRFVVFSPPPPLKRDSQKEVQFGNPEAIRGYQAIRANRAI